ncbi:hypothetical protein [Caballeronia sp. KNU42]
MELQNLLRDARVLAWYAARAGKLPANSEAFELIADLESITLAKPEHIPQLQKEIDGLVKAIAPVTLRHLLQRGSLIGYVRHTIAGVTPFVLGLLTLLLTLYLAFQSSQLNQADIAIREYQEWVNQQPREKLYAAWKMYRYERVLNVQTPPLAQLDAYQKLVDEARQSVEKGAAIQSLLTESALVLYLPQFAGEIVPESLRSFIASFNEGSVTSNTGKYLAPAPAGISPGEPCKDEPVRLSKVEISKATQMQTAEIDAYTNSFECFLNHLHISEQAMTYSAWPVIYQTKAKINLLVTWLLPGLYGLLGACVYVLRDLVLLRDNVAPVQDKRVVGILLILLRVALGGLAGIIIGWFWVPSSTPGNTSVVAVPISSIPFGLAFMAGFSIDTLFSLLDRVNKTIDSHETIKSTGDKIS